MDSLDAKLLQAHSEKNKRQLVALYSRAAQGADTTDEQAFFLTQAYVFALETDHPETNYFKTKLIEMGREE